jgi:hypothetical protein
MATVNTVPRDNRGGRAVTNLLVNENAQQSSRIRNATILLAIVMLGTAMATHAFAAGGMANDPIGGKFQDGHTNPAFHGPIVDQVPAMPAPTFNPSAPYTVPQPSETPVSPGSPGSIFGNR